MKLNKIFKRTSEINKISLIYFFLFVLVGLLQSYNNRHYIYSDLIATLDMSDNIYNKDLSYALNAIWSPLYPAILGLVLKILDPSIYYEAWVVYGLNSFIFITSFICFVFFINGLISFLKERELISDETDKNLIGVLYIVSYSLFLYCSAELLRSSEHSVTATPADTLVCCFIFLSLGSVLRIFLRKDKLKNYFLLSLYICLGYFSKPFFLAYGIVLFVLLILFCKRINVRRLLISIGIFIIICGTWIVFLSRSKGYFTTSDIGRLNYAWCVNLLRPSFIHWQGEKGTDNKPAHPTRIIFHDPDVYEFAYPVAGSYPPYYDISYWNEGMKIKFDLHQQYMAIKSNTVMYLRYSWSLMLAAVILTLITLGRKGRKTHSEFIRSGFFLFLAVASGMLMYLLINVEPRYVASFLLIFFILIFFSTVIALHKHNMKAAVFFASLICAFFIVKASVSIYRSTQDSYRYNTEYPQYNVAEYLKAHDLRSGDSVADVLSGCNHYWARLAGVRIVADISPFDEHAFWNADSLKKSEIYSLLKERNVKAVVSNELLKAPDDKGWEKVKGTDYYVMLLK